MNMESTVHSLDAARRERQGNLAQHHQVQAEDIRRIRIRTLRAIHSLLGTSSGTLIHEVLSALLHQRRMWAQGLEAGIELNEMAANNLSLSSQERANILLQLLDTACPEETAPACLERLLQLTDTHLREPGPNRLSEHTCPNPGGPNAENCTNCHPWLTSLFSILQISSTPSTHLTSPSIIHALEVTLLDDGDGQELLSLFRQCLPPVQKAEIREALAEAGAVA